MKRGDSRITCNWIQAGQSRAYADSFYEFILTLEVIPQNTNSPLEFVTVEWYDTVVKQYAQSYHHFKEKGKDKNIGWHEPVLKRCEKIGAGPWHFLIQEAFTD